MKLKKTELFQLFSHACDNSLSLFGAARHLTTHYDEDKFPSLGLAELALEELGKSYTCLAYYSKAETIEDWKIFWKEWKDHDLKAYRAFFYEFFCMLRIELDSQKFKESFPTIRGKFSKEKEQSFYVDIDKSNRRIFIPEKEVKLDECINRLTSLIGLINASFQIRYWFSPENSKNFKNAISDYAFLTITQPFYKQEVEMVLKKMRTNNEEYNKGLDAIWTLFNPNNSGYGKGLDDALNLIKEKQNPETIK